MRKMIKTRVIMENAKEIKFKNSKLKIYTKQDENGKHILQVFEGRKINPSKYMRYRTFEIMEQDIKYFVEKEQKNMKYKAEQKLVKKKRTEKLKKTLKIDSVLRSTFSYTMTFNYFYKVVSIKGSRYKLEKLEKIWVDGDIGYTGNVSAGEPTGEFVEGRLTSNGLKVDNGYASIINVNDTFYENHMD